MSDMIDRFELADDGLRIAHDGGWVTFSDIAALDAEFADSLRRDFPTDNLTTGHIKPVGRLLDLLRKLGCDKTADAFESLPKWYA